MSTNLRFNAALQTAIQQRNQSLDAVINLHAELAEKEARIQEMTARIAELEKQQAQVPVPAE